MIHYRKFYAIDFTDSTSILNSPGVYVAAFLVFILSCLAIRVLIQFYSKAGRIDVPNHRSMHATPTPTGAGIVLIAFLLVGAVYLFVNLASIQFLAITLVLAILGYIGWQDDKNNLTVRFRMIVFVVLALLVFLFVGVISAVSFGNFGVVLLPYPVAAILTLVGFIWLLNLYNFMDGMDGLAAMQTIMASLAFMVMFINIAFFSNSFFDELTYSSALALLCSILLASTLGFLVWNWSPAKIFMGDVGSLPVGGFFAISTIVAVRELEVSVWSCIAILGVFIFDASYTVIARLLRGEKITEAHRSHIYQRLDAMGVSHARIVLVYAIKMGLSAAAAVLYELGWINGLLASLVVLISVLFGLLWVQWLERSK